MKTNWYYIKALLLLLFIGFLYGFANHKNRHRQLADIQVSFAGGTPLFIDHSTVNKLLIQSAGTLENQPKSVVDLHKLEVQILSNPMIEDASIYLTVDGLLKADIRQRTPIARVFTESNNCYIDRKGGVMPVSENHTARVLTVTGHVSAKDSLEIHQLVSTILQDDFLHKQLVGIERTPENEYVLDTRTGGQRVQLGTLDRLERKCQKLVAFYRKAMADSTLENYTHINLSYKHQVVCTKK